MKHYGYEAHGDDGTAMRVEGAHQTDECFTGNLGIGTLNITAMWHDIRTGKAKGAKLRTVAITQSLMVALTNKDLDRETLEHMPADRYNLPIICIARDNGTHSLVDGNHRLAKRHSRDEKTVMAWELQESAIEEYQVKIYFRAPGGVFVLQTAEQLLDKTVGTYAERDGAGNVIGIRDERTANGHG